MLTWRDKMEAMGVTHKDCSLCGEYLHFDEFYARPSKVDGMSSHCRSCHRRIAQSHPDYDQKLRVFKATYKTSYKEFTRGRQLLKGIRNKAKRRGIIYKLDHHRKAICERVDAGFCELTGIPFNFDAVGNGSWDSPSIDRIKPELGYVYDNIRIVLHGLNMALGPWGEEPYRRIAQAYLERN